MCEGECLSRKRDRSDEVEAAVDRKAESFFWGFFCVREIDVIVSICDSRSDGVL